MPHKDHARYLAYLRNWKDRGGRPSPVAEDRAGLPSYGVMVYAPDGSTVQCHVCGRWFRRLSGHMQAHGLDAAAYKETFGLRRTTSTDAPVIQEENRRRALDRDQGSAGKRFGPEHSAHRPAGIEARLEQRIDASRVRKGLHMRAGMKTRPR